MYGANLFFALKLCAYWKRSDAVLWQDRSQCWAWSYAFCLAPNTVCADKTLCRDM